MRLLAGMDMWVMTEYVAIGGVALIVLIYIVSALIGWRFRSDIEPPSED